MSYKLFLPPYLIKHEVSNLKCFSLSYVKTIQTTFECSYMIPNYYCEGFIERPSTIASVKTLMYVGEGSFYTGIY